MIAEPQTFSRDDVPKPMHSMPVTAADFAWFAFAVADQAGIDLDRVEVRQPDVRAVDVVVDADEFAAIVIGIELEELREMNMRLRVLSRANRRGTA